jgi:hypothetical protein
LSKRPHILSIDNLKAVMSAFVSKLSAVWKLFDAQIRSMLTLPEREVRDFPFVASDVAQLHRLRSDPAGAALDDATWKDMLLDQYSAELAKEVSIFGQQVLHQRLRTGMGDTQPERIKALVDDPAQVKELHRLCTPLRHADQQIATLLYEDVLPSAPAWAGRTWLLPIALLASLAAVALSPLAWLAVFAVLYILMSTHLRFGDRIEQWQRSMNALQMLLRVVSLQAEEDAAQAGKINRALGRSAASGALPGMRAYADWFALADVKHYFKCVVLVRDKLDFLRACFTRIGNLEADLALACHLLQTPAYCWAARSGTGVIALADTVHPLLPQAQPLTLDLKGRGAFISGQNGIGKSTLLRTLGINLIAARAFGFCYASSATLPSMPVYASMQSEDSLLGGESLYMAELRRAKELLAAADGPHSGICIIDEIFRGTNHLESVSAAASVLDVLAAKGLVVVSSHNLVLAPLLAHRLDPLCVAREADGTLSLASGVLAHTNGIALLSQRGFGGQVEANAGKVFDWLSAYLAQPADCSAVLRAQEVACDEK